MPQKKSLKGQAALEYLITYGWALVAIVTIIGVLVLSSGGNINSNTCTTFLTILCKGIDAEGDQLIMVLQNATGQKITINPFTDIAFDGQYGYAKIIYQGQEYRFEDVTIGAGEEFKITAEGRVLASEMELTYFENQTGLTRTISSNMGTDAPDDIELSNDGIDNDGDGQTDCEGDATNCEYPVEITGPNGTPQTPITLTFDSTAVDNLLASGNWDIKDAYVYFYATNVSGAGIKAQIGTSQSANDITTGWNSVEIENFTWDLVFSNLIINASSGSFTIEGVNLTNTPKVVIVVEKNMGGGG